MRVPLFTLVLAVACTGTPIQAHHSFAAYYDEGRSISIEGRVQAFQLRSPHALLVVEVGEAGGRAEVFTAEWGSPRRLTRQGIAPDTLKPGDVVVITGSPGRTASENKVHLKGIRRPADGWSWGGRGRR